MTNKQYEALKRIVKKRKTGGHTSSILNLDEFHTLSEVEKVFAIHKYPELCFDCYIRRLHLLFNNTGDGFTKMGSGERVRTSNRTDPTAQTAMKRLAIEMGKLENAYEYGENETIDKLIELERAIKFYEEIIDMFDEKPRKVLEARIEGKSYMEIAELFDINYESVGQYIYMQKNYIEDFYLEVKEMAAVREMAKKKEQ